MACFWNLQVRLSGSIGLSVLLWPTKPSLILRIHDLHRQHNSIPIAIVLDTVLIRIVEGDDFTLMPCPLHQFQHLQVFI